MWNWHVTFVAIILVAAPVSFIIAFYMKPVAAHLALKHDSNAWRHLSGTVMVPSHLLAFAATALLVTGGYMIMPFSSVYTVNNLAISLNHLPTVYFVSGLFTIVSGPLIGRASDGLGHFNIFIFGCTISIVMVLIYTHLGHVSLPVVIAVSVVMFVGIYSRMIPSQVLMSAIPSPPERGSFNALNASMQQISGGVASLVAGIVVTQGSDGELQHFDELGYVIVATTLLSLGLMYFIQRAVAQMPR